jgi:hypothetical protein
MASWSVPMCRACHWRHDAAERCDPSRLAEANAARDADVQPGELIADTPRVWSKPGDVTDADADAYYRAHARLKP